MPINSKKENIFFYCLGILSIIFYGSVIYTQAVNMPKWDDFPDIMQFMVNWLSANNASEKITVFFYHTNEHILLVNHAITLAQYYFLGHLNFAWLIYIGNLFYLGSALILWLPFRQQKNSAFAFAILMLTGMTFYPYESTLWAMTAISNQAVIFFSLLAIYFATQPSLQISRTIFLTVLAIFSQSNGFFLLPIIAIIIFNNHKKIFIHWILFSISIILIYIYLFNPASGSHFAEALAALSPHHYLLTLPTFIAIFGATPFNSANLMIFGISIIIGLFILVFFIRQLLLKQYPAFLLSAMLFLLFCIASIVFYRGLVGGPSVIFISRYKMYGAYFAAIAVLLSPYWLKTLQTSPAKRYLTLLFSVCFFLASFYFYLPHSKLIDKHLRISLENWAEDGDLRRHQGFFIKDSDSYLFSALHSGVWSPLTLIDPDKIVDNISPLKFCPENISSTDTKNFPDIRIRHINRNAPAILMEFPPSNYSPGEWVMDLCAAEVAYRLHFTPPQHTTMPYITHYIPAADITPGNYKIYIENDEQRWALGETFLRKPHTR